MTPDEVRHLVAAGETYTVEFKRGTRRTLNDSAIVTAVVCLANGNGGTLLLGVEDDGTISGLEPRHDNRTEPHLLRALILNHTEPPVATHVEVVEVDGVDVCVISVPDIATPVGTTSGMFVRRAIKADGRPECVPYRAHEIISTGLSVQGRDYAETLARGLVLDDLDTAEFDRFRTLCREGGGDLALANAGNLEVLRALRLLPPDASAGEQLTLGAVLLFGRPTALSEHVPTAEALFQEIRRGAVAANETIRSPLFKAADRLHSLIDVRNSEEELILGMQRIGVPRIPDKTIRESVANALTHRDYAELGPVTVQLSEDELRVSSPGGFPPGITLANLLDDSKPRSVILADAFKRAGFVDRAGRGVKEMYVALLRAGRGGPDYTSTNEKAVIVTIPTSRADLDMVRFVLRHEEESGEPLTLLQLRILHEVKSMGPETLAELHEALRQSETSVRGQITRLIEMGLVEARGMGRNRRHHLTAAFHRAAESSAYVRLRDTDPIQQDQMVLSYVESFGSITRAKAAELCRLSPQQARGVLKRLVDAGELELRGERRASHYVRAEGRP